MVDKFMKDQYCSKKAVRISRNHLEYKRKQKRAISSEKTNHKISHRGNTKKKELVMDRSEETPGTPEFCVICNTSRKAELQISSERSKTPSKLESTVTGSDERNGTKRMHMVDPEHTKSSLYTCRTPQTGDGELYWTASSYPASGSNISFVAQQQKELWTVYKVLQRKTNMLAGKLIVLQTDNKTVIP
nr:unnamed protein product [Callosobruchus analis]